jgi:hypothetical protein
MNLDAAAGPPMRKVVSLFTLENSIMGEFDRLKV